MENNKVALIVIENRPFIATEYAKLLTKIAWNRMVYWIKFWDGEKQRPIWFMRQSLIEQILEETDCTHILFIDSDVIPTDDDFIQRLVSYDVPVVSGVYYDANEQPVNRKGGMPYNFLGSGLAEVDVCSMGLSLIKREVLEKVPYPKPVPLYKPDADVEWCFDIKKAGYPIYSDMSIVGKHFFHHYFDGGKFKQFMENDLQQQLDKMINKNNNR